MKHKLFYLSLLVAAAFTGCSKSDVDEATAGGTQGADVGYVAVSVVQVQDNTSRAGAYEAGDPSESIAKEGLFFIYSTGDKTGKCQRVKFVGHTPQTPSAGNQTVERIYDAVLVVDGEQTSKAEELHVICVLNPPSITDETLDDDLDGITSLPTFMEKIGDFSVHTPYKFIMSNAVYANASDASMVHAGESLAGHVFSSAPQAYANPVDIYVERVVAKVLVNTPTGGMTNNKGTVDVKAPVAEGENYPGIKVSDHIGNVEEKKFKIVLKGAEIANIASQSYLIKEISNFQRPDLTYWDWNDPNNKRSYWETVPAPKTEVNTTGMPFWNKSYNQINSDCPFVGNTLPTGLKEYIQPNTTGTYKSAVLVTAQLQNEDGSAADLAYVRGGYTTKRGALNVVVSHIAQKYGLYVKIAAGTGDYDKDKTNMQLYRQINEDYFEWKNNNDFDPDGTNSKNRAKNLKDYEVVAQVAKIKTAEGVETNEYPEFYQIENKGTGGQVAHKFENGAEIVNKYLKAYYVSEEEYKPSTQDDVAVESNAPQSEAIKYRAQVYTNGLCYYFEYIDHTPVAVENEKPIHDGNRIAARQFEGVVRNHVYKLTLNDIMGVGTPIFDPTDVIIPTIPETEKAYYLAAQVHVLGWRLVTQDVSFDGQ